MSEEGQIDAGATANDHQHGTASLEGLRSVIDGGQGGPAGRLDENPMVVREAEAGTDCGRI